MRKKNRGFIATSLIYSFFLVFIAVIAALISNYLSNKTILDRFNDDVMKKLNTGAYTVTVYAKNAKVQNGVDLTNLVLNGTFKGLDTINYWTKIGSCNEFIGNQISLVSGSSLRKSACELGSGLIQKISITKNRKYYYSINYLSDVSTPIYVNFDNSKILLDQTSQWVKVSKVVDGSSNYNTDLIIGNNPTSSFMGNTYFTNAMVLDLTTSFGENNEPDATWIDNNIDYFEGTISYFKLEKINNGSSATIRFNLNSYENSDDVKCFVENTDTEVNIIKSNLITDETGKYMAITIDSINSNINCYADWK